MAQLYAMGWAKSTKEIKSVGGTRETKCLNAGAQRVLIGMVLVIFSLALRRYDARCMQGHVPAENVVRHQPSAVSRGHERGHSRIV